MELRKTFGRFVDGGALTPKGWLRRQLQLQADGQAGNLDKFWPDVKDSAWIGGKAEGWERVPYWLDGFIDLAWLLDDDDMKAVHFAQSGVEFMSSASSEKNAGGTDEL